MDLVNEENVTFFEISQHGGQVAGFFKHRTRRCLDGYAHLIGDDIGKGCFAQTGRAKDQNVVQRFLTTPGRGYENIHLLTDRGLANILGQQGRANGPVLYFLIFTGPGRDQPVGFDHGITHSVGINIVPHVCPLFQRSPNCTKGLAGVTLRSLQVRDRF